MRKIKAFILDYDGVIAESNDIKTFAFRDLFRNETEENIEKLISFHISNEGISRIEKINYFYTKILRKEISDDELSSLSLCFSKLVKNKVIACKKVEGVRKFLKNNSFKYKFFISTGTPTNEMKYILEQTDMEIYFQEILGSPETKIEHISFILKKYKYKEEELIFIGDSKTDLLAAKKYKIKFILRSHEQNSEIASFHKGQKIKNFNELTEF